MPIHYHAAVTLGIVCVGGILALLQGTIKAKEERRGTPADGFAARRIPVGIARSISALLPLGSRQAASLQRYPQTLLDLPEGFPGCVIPR